MSYSCNAKGGWVVKPGRKVGHSKPLRIPRNSWIGDGAHVGPGCHVGANTRIGRGVTLGRGVVIESDCTIGRNLKTMSGVYIGLRCVIGVDAHFGNHVVLKGATLLLPGAHFGRGATLGPGVSGMAPVTLEGTPDIHGTCKLPSDAQLSGYAPPPAETLPEIKAAIRETEKHLDEAAMPEVLTFRERMRRQKQERAQAKRMRELKKFDPRYLEPMTLMDLPPTHGANEHFPDGSQFPPGTSFGPGCTFGDDCIFGTACIIDHGHRIGENARFGQRCVIGKGTVGRGAKLGAHSIRHAETWFDGGAHYYGPAGKPVKLGNRY